MENASKALIIAGSLLIALLVISLLVMFYNNIKDFEKVNHNADVSEQISEFNKQYDVYYRDNLYGSDILSIANKVVDYNKRESDTEGYSRVETKVTFKSKSEAILLDNLKITLNKECDAQTIYNFTKKLEDDVSKRGKEHYKNTKYSISYLSGCRSEELKILLNVSEIPAELKEKKDNYLINKSLLTTIKSKAFKATEFKYDKGTARISLMKFQEV